MRDVNRAHFPLIREALPEPVRPAFEHGYHVAAMREWTGRAPLHSREFLKAVMALDSLTDEQRELFASLRISQDAAFIAAVREVIRTNDAYRHLYFNEADPQPSNAAAQLEKAKLDEMKLSIARVYKAEQHAIDTVWLSLTDDQRQVLKKPTVRTPDLD